MSLNYLLSYKYKKIYFTKLLFQQEKKVATKYIIKIVNLLLYLHVFLYKYKYKK